METRETLTDILPTATGGGGAPRKAGRILIVDDQPANLDVLRQVLEMDGHQVLLAPSGKVALRSAAKGAPDLILLDVMMPEMDGYEVCRRLKEDPLTQPIPVVFITANDDTDDIVAGFEAGAMDYIAKPFKQSEVLTRVRSHLALFRLTQELERKNADLAVANVEIQETHKQLDAAQKKLIDQLDGELNKARHLQMGLMPSSAPAVSGLDLAGTCRPATHVGGDYYQFFSHEDGTVTVCLADVTGHSMEAAIPAARFDGILDSQIEIEAQPAALMNRLNERLAKKMPGMTHVCCLLAQVDGQSGQVQMANAGNPFPQIYRTEQGEVSEVVAEAYPLSVRDSTNYESVAHDLAPGDALVLCTDGVIETRNSQGDVYGDDRLRATIQRACTEAEGSADMVLRRILSELQAFAGEGEQDDDQTVVVVIRGEA
ncbi:MAG: SpoIIE family protein phosphatase [Gemmatimonadetes bacterium]|nr:SpoIIE family protein phosphatase [Gemmatimonadota bacterium]